ncbi:MAG: polysaccharide biosynthesis protein [bacterium]|nr:polysaccharide biosynthesis protein [bacterium]
MYKKLNSTTRLAIKLLIDAFLFLLAIILSYFLRFNTWDDSIIWLKKVIHFVPLFILIRLCCFYFFRLYSTMWRYSALHTFFSIVKADALGTVLIILTDTFYIETNLPRGIIVLDFFLVLVFTGGIRLFVRWLNTVEISKSKEHKETKRVLIYGAGDAGEQLLRSILSTKDAGLHVVGFVDDDKTKLGQYIHSKKVLGTRSDIGNIVKNHNVDAIYFCVPSLSGAETRGILSSIKQQINENIEVKTIPGLSDIVTNEITISHLRKFEIKDLLRRKQIHLDTTPVRQMIQTKNVLVVGGGGSIGLELCRQIASFQPNVLIVSDSSEYNVYRAELELKQQYPKIEIIPMVADACNETLMQTIFRKFNPELVFHAAAYKHVPLMEMNPWAAIYNNVKSTLVLTDLANQFEVKRFILISSDKAVNPTSIMGATKRMCEIICLLKQNAGNTDFISVRFGNVLGSSGSVIPLFKEQIEKGGPVTVTHPDITRFFMLISEAVELVLQAGAIGERGKIYVLDMGEPIRIADLAEYMITLSGLRPNVDIQIVYTGLRPGEKMYEDLYLGGNEVPTKIPNVFVIHPSLNFHLTYLEEVEKLLQNQYSLSIDQLKQEIKKFVPEYQLKTA